jgi:glutamine amidotransferase
LESCGLIPILNECAKQKQLPILGICLGAQLLAQSSEEGKLPGLGWIDADIVRFDPSRMGESLKIPHMGWAEVERESTSHLFQGYQEQPRFYFVHAFHFRCNHPGDVSATAVHGYSFPAAVEQGNIMGVQFHPEKSHRYGMALLANFMTYAQQKVAAV